MYFRRSRQLMVLFALLSLSLPLLLSGCRNPDDSAADHVQGRVALVIKPADRSGDAMSARLLRSDAFKNLHVVTAIPGLPAEEQLRLLSEEGYLMIVASSPDFALDVTIVAPDFLEIVYVIFGAIVEGDNVASVLPDYTESLKKAGVLAALAADYLPLADVQQHQPQKTVSFITTAANPGRNEWEQAFAEGVARVRKPVSVISGATAQTGNRGQRSNLDQLINKALQQNAYLICIDGNITMDQMSERLGERNTYVIGIEHDISVLVPGKVVTSVIAFPELILLPILEDARQKKFIGAVLTPSDKTGGVGFTNLHGLTISEEEFLKKSNNEQQQQQPDTKSIRELNYMKMTQVLNLRKTLPWNIEELLEEQLGTKDDQLALPEVR